MINRIVSFMRSTSLNARVAACLSRAAATAPLREIDPKNPATWEFSGFSQNGEDGIIDYLSRQVRHPNNYFVEIGSADGVENNTAWLAYGRKYSGLMIEANPRKVARSRRVAAMYNLGVDCICLFVKRGNIESVKESAKVMDPDCLSLDVDGIDYHLAEEMLKAGFRPKIFVVEYNSAFGPDAALTIPYSDNFDYQAADTTRLYYGVSIEGWRRLFERFQYTFVTVDQNGINAFFVKTDEFDKQFLSQIKGLRFRENVNQLRIWKEKWEGQFKRINHRAFLKIND